MQSMRDILQSSIGKALGALSPLDRLSAAWPVVAGHAIASCSSVVSLNGTIVTVEVRDKTWQQQLNALRSHLLADVAKTSRVTLTDILFTLPQKAAKAPRT